MCVSGIGSKGKLRVRCGRLHLAMYILVLRTRMTDVRVTAGWRPGLVSDVLVTDLLSQHYWFLLTQPLASHAILPFGLTDEDAPNTYMLGSWDEVANSRGDGMEWG